MIKKKKQELVTPPPKRQYAKRHHVVCVCTRICNKFGNMPSIECAKAGCEYARKNEYVCDITPAKFSHSLDLDTLNI